MRLIKQLVFAGLASVATFTPTAFAQDQDALERCEVLPLETVRSVLDHGMSDRWFIHQSIMWGHEFLPDQQRILTWSEDGTTRLWNLSTGDELLRVEHEERVVHAQLSPNGQLILAQSIDRDSAIPGKVIGFDAETGERRFEFEDYFLPERDWNTSYNSAFLPDGSAFHLLKAYYGPDGDMLLYSDASLHSSHSGEEINSFPIRLDLTAETIDRIGLYGSPTRLNISPRGDRVVVLGSLLPPRLHDVQTGERIALLDNPIDRPDLEYTVHRSVDFHPDGRTLWTNDALPGETLFFDASTGRALDASDLPAIGERPAGHLWLSPDGRYFIDIPNDGSSTRVRDGQTLELIGEPALPVIGVFPQFFEGLDRALLIYANPKRGIFDLPPDPETPPSLAQLVDLQSGQILGDPHSVAHNQSQVTVSPDQTRIAFLDHTTKVTVLDAVTGAHVFTSPPGLARWNGLTFTPDSQGVLTASEEEGLRLLDANTGALIALPLARIDFPQTLHAFEGPPMVLVYRGLDEAFDRVDIGWTQGVAMDELSSCAASQLSRVEAERAEAYPADKIQTFVRLDAMIAQSYAARPTIPNPLLTEAPDEVLLWLSEAGFPEDFEVRSLAYHPREQHAYARQMFDENRMIEGTFWAGASSLRGRVRFECGLGIDRADYATMTYPPVLSRLHSETIDFEFSDLDAAYRLIDRLIYWYSEAPDPFAPRGRCAAAREEVFEELRERQRLLAEGAVDIQADRANRGLILRYTGPVPNPVADQMQIKSDRLATP